MQFCCLHVCVDVCVQSGDLVQVKGQLVKHGILSCPFAVVEHVEYCSFMLCACDSNRAPPAFMNDHYNSF